MALAETAALVSSLELKDKFTPTVNKFDKSISQLEKRSSTFGKIGGHVGQGLGSAVANLTKLAVVGAAAVGTQVKFGLDALRELGAVTAQTNAVLRSTGGVAGETADDIVRLSEKYEDLNALIDNKVIQSGENLLLTFTNIRTKAFEPTLQAALDMNQAMGGGEAGLQGTIQKLGKALNDPVKGLTALGRVGVTFSDAQKKQIKDLVAHNKLYEAQKVILDELTKRFGGSFASAGKTADGTFAALGDSAEDLQMALAEGVLPALVDVAKELAATFKDPSTKSAVRDFGKGIGDAFREGVKFAKQIPWAAIGEGLKTAASAAGTLIQKFGEAPDWLKTAVITGWGLNKLTGGALTGIGGEIAKAVGGNFLSRGASPANPLFVKEIAPATGAGGGVVAGGKGLLGTVLSFVPAIAASVVALNLGQQFFGTDLPAIADQEKNIKATWNEFLKTGTVQELTNAMKGIEEQFASNPAGALDQDTLNKLRQAFEAEMTRRANPSSEDKNIANAVAAAMAGGGSHSEDRKIELASIDAIRANTVAVRATATTLEKSWLKSIDPDKIGARSKAVTGKTATPAQIAAIRSRDILHQLEVITSKSKASNETKLARLQALVKEGDPKTREKVKTAIADMKAKIALEQSKTTTAVTTGTNTLDQAIAAAKSQVTVNVTTEITANGVTKATTHSNVYGPSDSTNKGTTGGKVL